MKDEELRYPQCLTAIGIKLLEPFTNSTARTLMQCLSCNYEWTSTPLLRMQSYRSNGGNGCPNCVKIGHLTSDVVLSQIDMEQRLASLNDNEITKMKQIDRELYDAIDNATIEVHKQLITNAQLIGKSTNIPRRIRQKVWHVIHNNYNIVKCIECNNGVAWNQMENRYRDFCSSKCSHNNEVVKQSLGAKEHQTKEHKVRRINEKHGTDFETIAEAYQSGLYDHTYEGRKGRSRSQVEFTKEEQMAINEKRRMTNLERYGVDHHMQNKEIQSAVHEKEWLPSASIGPIENMMSEHQSR